MWSLHQHKSSYLKCFISLCGLKNKYILHNLWKLNMAARFLEYYLYMKIDIFFSLHGGKPHQRYSGTMWEKNLLTSLRWNLSISAWSKHTDVFWLIFFCFLLWTTIRTANFSDWSLIRLMFLKTQHNTETRLRKLSTVSGTAEHEKWKQ